MTREQINQYISTIDSADLDAIKMMVAARENELYDIRWWTHEKIDDYLYIVHYRDGRKHLSCKGADSYQEYIRNDDATWIERKTKDLFPTYETLMRKETA